jgi:heme-degrading monooxygenase HmoA
MILELAILSVRPGHAETFERAFAEARSIIASMPGFHSLRLERCLEKADRYALLVEWESLEHHTVGFRQSAEYLEWKRLLHHFYDPFPTVEHYENVIDGRRGG